MRVGRHTAWIALLGLAATVALPGSGVHFHRHAGGEHAHAHPDEVLDAEAPDDDHDHDVADPHHRPDPAGRPILTDDDGAPAHAHVRPLFQPALPFLLEPAVAIATAPLDPVTLPPAPSDRTLAAARSRGPPSSTHG